MIEFFIPLDKLPTVTAQQKGVRVVNGRPHFYKKKEVEEVEEFYKFILKTKRPKEPMTGAIGLTIGYLFPAKRPHRPNEPKTTRPDTDNLIKLVKDVMTEVGFWVDDSQVFCETYFKIYSTQGGLYFKVEEYNITDKVTEIRQEVRHFGN